MLPFQKSDRGLIHIQSPEVWHIHLQTTQSLQRRKRHHSEVYQREFEVVQLFEGQRWVTDASINMTTGLITVPTIVQANLLKCSRRPLPQINEHTWHHFEQYQTHGWRAKRMHLQRYHRQSTCLTLAIQRSVQSSPRWNTNFCLNWRVSSYRSEECECWMAVLVSCRWCEPSRAVRWCWRPSKPYYRLNLRD